VQKQRSFFSTLAAVAWSFVGLRRKKDFDADADGAINPLYVVIAALVGLILFIGTLLFFVRMAVRA
jgi:hypothetical protein